jgi:nitroreductase
MLEKSGEARCVKRGWARALEPWADLTVSLPSHKLTVDCHFVGAAFKQGDFMSELYTGQSPQTIDLLLRRRSASAKALTEPGPGAEDVRTILQAGARVPDHGKLAPWRFIMFEGEARAAFGAVLARVLTEREPDAGDIRRDMELKRFSRAPLVIAVVSSPKTGKPIPEWEQRLSAGAVCQNMVIAATALGYGANWITEWCAYDEGVCKALGLSGDERVAGFIYLGARGEALRERERPNVDQLVSHWQGE